MKSLLVRLRSRTDTWKKQLLCYVVTHLPGLSDLTVLGVFLKWSHEVSPSEYGTPGVHQTRTGEFLAGLKRIEP